MGGEGVAMGVWGWGRGVESESYSESDVVDGAGKGGNAFGNEFFHSERN